MKFNTLSRRFFLTGAGTTLALPLLPSLLSRAEADTLRAPRFFVSSWLPHGGLAEENLYPLDATVSLTAHQLFPATTSDLAHTARWGELKSLRRTHAQTEGARTQMLPDADGGRPRVSPVIGSFVEDALLDKLLVLRGLDMLGEGGHGLHYLGDYTNKRGTGTETCHAEAPVPTIDGVLAASDTFYPPAERATVRAPAVLFGSEMLSTHRIAGTVSPNPYRASTAEGLHALLFAGVQSTPGTPVDPRVALIDLVTEDYRRLTKGTSAAARRLGKEDRLRLEAYAENTHTIAARMRAAHLPGCAPVTVAPADRYRGIAEPWGETGPLVGSAAEEAAKRTFEVRNVLLVQAFLCGTSRAAVLQLPDLVEAWNPEVFSTPSSIEVTRTDQHGLLFHNHGLPDRQRFLVKLNRFFFEHSFIDLARRMRATEVLPGVSMLDQAVLHFGAESGPLTHSGKSLPAILAGGGGGFFKPGKYVDYRQIEKINPKVPGWATPFHPGLAHNQLLGNLLQAMGLSPAEYELSDAAYSTKFPQRGGRVPGYGDPGVLVPTDQPPHYSARIVQHMGDKLPLVT